MKRNQEKAMFAKMNSGRPKANITPTLLSKTRIRGEFSDKNTLKQEKLFLTKLQNVKALGKKEVIGGFGKININDEIKFTKRIIKSLGSEVKNKKPIFIKEPFGLPRDLQPTGKFQRNKKRIFVINSSFKGESTTGGQEFEANTRKEARIMFFDSKKSFSNKKDFKITSINILRNKQGKAIITK